jgi:hypothetical protein
VVVSWPGGGKQSVANAKMDAMTAVPQSP